MQKSSVLIVVLLFCISFQQKQQSIFSFKLQMQEVVLNLESNFLRSYQSQKEEDCYCPKAVSVYDECVGTDATTCYEDFPQHNKCLTEGVSMSVNHAYRVLQKSINKKQLSCEQIAFICNSDTLQNVLKNDINTERNFRYSKAYIGSESGIFMTYPASTPESVDLCKNYDPRLRPWYITASTGGRDSLIFFSIKQSKNLQRAKEIGQYLITTSNIHDWVLVVNANNCSSGDICKIRGRPTNQYKQKLSEYIDNLSSNSPNSEANLNRISNYGQIIFPTTSTSTNISRNNIILITDFVPGSTTLENQLNMLKRFDPRLISVIIGNTNENLTALQQLTASSNGLLIHDSDPSQYVLNTMRDYSVYFSQGLNINEPVWSPIYEDAFGFGLIVTIAMPSYIQNKTSGEKQLIGVIGIDVALTVLQKIFSLTNSEIFEEFDNFQNHYIQENPILPSGFFDGYSDQTLIQWLEGTSYEEGICCGITVAGFIVLMVFVGIIIILTIVFACFYKKICCFQKKGDEHHEEYRSKGEQKYERKQDTNNVNQKYISNDSEKVINNDEMIVDENKIIQLKKSFPYNKFPAGQYE